MSITNELSIAELEDKIDLLELVKSEHDIKSIGSNKYWVNPCPVCGHNDHFTVYADTNSYSSFNQCCKGGKAYKYLMEVKGLDEVEAREKLEKLSNSEQIESPITPKPTKAEVKEPSKDYTNLIVKLYNSQKEKESDYLLDRGMTKAVIEKYKICVGSLNADSEKRVIIPHWQNGKVTYYTARAITSGQEPKYKNATGKAIFFGLDNLKEADKVFITEGAFDALSLEILGYKAISVNGTNGATVESIKTLQNKYPKIIFYSALDNDDPGQRAAEKLEKELSIKPLKIKKGYKDVNEWFIHSKTELNDAIKELEINSKRPNSLYDYMSNGFMNDLIEYRKYSDRKSGFDNLDSFTSIYPGLYVLGGLSTLGKTTFIHQLADQMAEKGEHVLYFSLEMSRLELITKSLARYMVMSGNGYDYDYGASSLNIRLNNLANHKRERLEEAITRYEPVSKRFNVIEGNFNTNVTTIRETIERYILLNQVKPVIVIDYLQIIPGRKEDRSDKERIDGVVTELKRISRDFNISVLVISSLNRTNYLTPIDFESFKESGGIEYTADVVWGLQLQVINDDTFNKQGQIKEKREMITFAKRADPRKIELVCLKNRNGISSYTCLFDYRPGFDLFIPMGNKEQKVLPQEIRRR